MTLTEAYALLRKYFGTHRDAAKHLGMAEQHYNALRNGRANMNSRTAEFIILKAQEASAQESGPPPPVASAAPEVRP